MTCLVRCRQKFIMQNNTFRCLQNLESIKMMFDQLTDFNKSTFTGLENVGSLDLTDCQRLCSPALITALSDNKVLPVLSKLILQGLGSMGCSIEIEVDQTFVDLLGARPIQILDLSYSSIIFIHPDLKPLCDSLTAFYFTNSTFSVRSKLNDTQVCRSLQILDLSGVHFPRNGMLPFSINVTNKNITLDRGLFYLNVNNLYINYLVSKDYSFFFQNCTVSIHGQSLATHCAC